MGTLNLIKTKKICSAKDPDKAMRRHLADWEKLFANHIANKGLVLRIYDFQNSTVKKKKWATWIQ